MHLRSISPPKITHKLDIIQIINDIMNIILFVFFIITLTVYYAMKYISCINNNIFIIIFIVALALFTILVYYFHLLHENHPEISQDI